MSIVDLKVKKFPMTLLINLDNGPIVIDAGNTYNNSPEAVYLVNLIGYHKVKITRMEVMRQTGGASFPIVLALVSPVFQQTYGNYRYPCFMFDQNITPLPANFGDIGRATNVSNDTEYIYNFDGTMPLFVADIYQGYLGAQTFFDFQPPARTLICVLSLEVEKMQI
jgi:hypothetical protein